MAVLYSHKEHARQPGLGPPLVVLHGLFGTWDNWGTQIRRLAEHRDVYGLDIRNHGESPHLPETDYPSMAQDVIDTLASLALSSVILLGHSMGGKIALNAASLAPGQIERLIIVDIAPKAYPPHHTRILAGLNALEPTTLASRKEADQRLQPYVSSAVVRAFLLKNLRREAGGGYRLKLNLPALTDGYDQVMRAPEKTARLTQPTLLIHGSESDYVDPVADQSLLAEWFDNCQLVAIGGAGHWPHASHPDTVYDAITAFFQDPPDQLTA